MVILTGYLLGDVLMVLGTMCCVLYWYQTKNFHYWRDRGVPFVEPHWLFGSFGKSLLKKSSWSKLSSKIYNKYKDERYVGVFVMRKPAIYILDPDLVGKVMAEDFVHFHDRAVWYNPGEPLADSLYNARGHKWRILRTLLVPAFTSGKVKGMFEQMLNCGDLLLKEIQQTVKGGESVEVEEMVLEFVTEVIVSCIFGVQLKSDPDIWNELINVINRYSNASAWRITKIMLAIVNPVIVKVLNIHLYERSVTAFFVNLTKSVVSNRRKVGIKRDDFLQIILNVTEQEYNTKYGDLNGPKKETNRADELNPSLNEIILTDNTVASLMFNFVAAGVKPTTTTISIVLCELARNNEIQNRLQKEIDCCIGKNGGLVYEAVKDMTYLDQVVQEIQRLYTVTPILAREVSEPYRIPGTDLVLEKGMEVYIPVADIHMDPKFYPEPEQFNPDRFDGNSFKPSPLFLPFGHGPRICIAVKFTVLMIKVCLVKILSKYSVKLSSKMHLPLRLDDSEFLLKVNGGVGLSFHARKVISG